MTGLRLCDRPSGARPSPTPIGFTTRIGRTMPSETISRSRWWLSMRCTEPYTIL